jgi:predicted small metal-binding protein
MAQDVSARGLLLTTLDWPDQARSIYYAPSGTLNPEDGTLVQGDQKREIVARLVELIRMAAKGTFVPDQEKDKLSAAIGTREHDGCC